MDSLDGTLAGMSWWKRWAGRREDAIFAVEVQMPAPPPFNEGANASGARYAGMGQGARASAMRRDGLSLSALDQCYADEHDAEFVRGKHFLEWGDELQELKRQGRLEEALKLALEVIEATERGQAVEAQNAPTRADYLHRSPDQYQPRETPPGWTEQAAIILRKLGRIEEEIAVIDRWIAHAGARERWVGQTHSKLLDRRAKAASLLATKGA